jgi:hypothetical protein
LLKSTRTLILFLLPFRSIRVRFPWVSGLAMAIGTRIRTQDQLFCKLRDLGTFPGVSFQSYIHR